MPVPRVGHDVQGFGAGRESNINQTAAHSPYVIHRILMFVGHEVVPGLVICNELTSTSSSNLRQFVGRTLSCHKKKSWSFYGCRKQGQCSRLMRE